MREPGFRRGACALLMVLAAGVGCNRVEVAPLPIPAGPSVLLVTIDTLRADHAGPPHMDAPTLERLAAEGVAFERAMATAPLTLPSHASMLTGLYPPSHGVRHNGVFELDEKFVTVAERLGDAGYATAAVVSASVLSSRFGLDQGFDVYDDRIEGDARASAAGFAERSAATVTDRAVHWLAETDRPFFLWVHYYDAHADYAPPEPFRSRYPDTPYRGEVAYVDHELGRLLEALDQSERRADTIVAVTSDHGEGLGQHGEGTHSYLIYDSVAHVPLILQGPGIPSGARVPEVVSNVGLGPTLVALAGAVPLPDPDVGDLSPLWREAHVPDADAWAYTESLAGRLDFGWSAIHGVRANRLHYVRAPRRELFDTMVDPAESRNLLLGSSAAAAAPHAEALDARLDPLLAGERAPLPLAIDPEMRARIESLGYAVPSGLTEETGEDPKDVHVHAANVHRALGHVMDERWEPAEALAREALEVLPGSGQAHYVLARVEMARGRPDRALPHAEKAVRLYPEGVDHQVQLGMTRLALRDIEGAVAAFEAATRLDDEHAGALLGMMWRRAIGGSLEGAQAHAARASAVAPDPAQAALSVASQWERLGEYDLALDAYRDALERFPEHQNRVHMHLAILWARFGHDERADAHRANAGGFGNDAELATRLAIVYAARGELGRAERLLAQQVERHPEDPRPKSHLMRLLRQRRGEVQAPPASPATGLRHD